MPTTGLVTIGSRIGVMIMMSGAISMKNPSTNNSRLMMNNSTYLLSEIDTSALVIMAGMRRSVIM